MADGMPVLTLWQPWATLIAVGAKMIETRSWSTRVRGRIAIHAAARRPTAAERQVGDYTVRWHDRLGEFFLDHDLTDATFHELPLGVIVATAELYDVVPMVEPDGTVTPAGGGSLVVEHDGRLTLWDPPDYMGEANERDVTNQAPYGDYTAGRYAWLLADVEPLDDPVPFRGGQGLTRRWTP